MILKIRKAESLKGEFVLPSSKSYSIRAFMVASCGGTSRIVSPSNCDDAKVAMETAKALGAKIKCSAPDICIVNAYPGQVCSPHINVRESGTVLRFLLPLISLSEQPATIAGDGTLRGRPNRFLNETLRSMGVDIRGKGEQESVPIVKKGGRLKGGRIVIDGSLSSQFISALLISAPLLEEDTDLEIVGDKIVSETYIQMTLQILKKAGIEIRRTSPRKFSIRAGQDYSGLKNFTVPADYGLAAFFLAAGALVTSRLTLKGYLKKDFVQADGAILGFLKKMGVDFTEGDRYLKIAGPTTNLKGGDFSLKDCPDLVPIMAVLALFAKGKTRLLDVAHARAKESDRLEDLRRELLKVGARVTAKPKELIIEPQPAYKENILLDPHHDHRLAMAFSVLGLKLGARVKDIECTSKSYPDFVRDLKSVGVKFN